MGCIVRFSVSVLAEPEGDGWIAWCLGESVERPTKEEAVKAALENTRDDLESRIADGCPLMVGDSQGFGEEQMVIEVPLE